MRRSMSMQPNRISTGVTGATGIAAARRFALVASVFLVLAPVASLAEEPAASETAEAGVDRNGDVPIVTNSQSDASQIEVPDGEIAPPEGYEVISIKGRAVSGIETDVPESVTQFDAEAIARLGAGNIADLAKVTPNVEIRVAGATAATFFIRGVGLSDFSANAAGAVAIYKDDVVMNTPAIQLGSLFDLKTVEIVRGPAGIGSHRNASAGAIKIYANKPTAEYAARIKQTLGSFWSDDARDAFIRDTEGFVNLPLIEETLAMRVAFRVREQDPYMTNGCGDAPAIADRTNRPPIGSQRENLSQVCGEGLVIPRAKSPVPVGLPTKVGNKSDWAARGAFRLQPPGTDMDWLLSFHGSRLDQDSTLGQFTGVGDSADILGTASIALYQEPDQAKEELRLKLKFGRVDTLDEFNALPLAERTAAQDKQQKLQGKNLASGRPLDREPYRGDYNRVGKTTLDIWGGHLRGEFSLGPIDVTTITAYESYERFIDSDRDFTPDSLFEAVSTDDAKQFVQELNLSGEFFDAAVHWNLGGAYLAEELHIKAANIEAERGADTDPFRIRTQIFTFNALQDTSAFMTYADLRWTFLEDFDLQVGARLNVEKKDFTLGRVSIAGFFERSESKQWTEPTGKIGLTYHLNDRIDLHATYTRGYKAGHFNTNNISFKVADPEFIDSFEWRMNLNAFDRRLLVQAGFFYYKYKDYQVFIFTDEPGAASTPNLVIRNANRVQQYGSEVELSLKPLEGWVPEPYDGLTLGARFGWLASQFLDFTNTVFRNGPQGGSFDVVIDFSGSRLINSPEFKISGSVDWPFDLGEWGKLSPHYDFVWTDDIFFDGSEGRGTPGVNILGETSFRLPKYTLGQKAYWIHNLRLAYQTPIGNVEVAGWVKNVLDQRYKTYNFDVSLFAKGVINFVGDPRSAGVDVTINW